MEDFSAPSFSLGFDLDIADLPTEGEEEEEEADHPSPRPSPDKWVNEEESCHKPSVQESEDFEETITLDRAQEVDPPRRLLKRLRRGPPPPPLAEVATPRPPEDFGCLINESPPSKNIYDDIEEFSSPEKELQRCTDDYPSTQSHITCGNTKFSLFRRGFLRDKSDGKQVASQFTPASSGVSTSTRPETSNVKYPFPRLTISPIRKINLVDSDSDDSPTSKGDYKRNEVNDVSLKKGKWFHEKSSTCEGQKNFLASKHKPESFWKDFSPIKNKKFETPALDEFCKEYFVSARDQNVNQSNVKTKPSGFSNFRGPDIDDGIDGNDLDRCKNIGEKVCINWDLSSPQPPAYQYFCHTDPRIRTLVHQRLPHFIPLGNESNDNTQQLGAKNIDYMSQFNTTCSSGKAHVVPEKASRSRSSKKQNRHSCYNVIETTDATGSWVNPRSKATVPKDAGKRRVSADVHQSGQWFTDQTGRKVYVSKDGEQSTGRMAYMKYKKETGGLRKPRKKAGAKRGRNSKR